MSNSLVIKDGNGDLKSLQVSSSSFGYIANNTLVTDTNGSVNSGLSGYELWSSGKTGYMLLGGGFDNSKKSLIISNNSVATNCYIRIGGTYLEAEEDPEAEPGYYSFILEPGGVYFSDITMVGAPHSVYIPSSSTAVDWQESTIKWTSIY